MRTSLLCLSLVVPALAPLPVLAQTRGAPPPGATPTAERFFNEGREAMRAGDFGGACPKFAQSQRLDPSLGTLLNLGLCEEQLGDLVSARAHLREFVSNVPASDDRLAAAAEHLAALDRRVPRLEVRLAPGASPSTQLFVDGVAVGAPGPDGRLTLPLNPGPHELVASAPGERTARYALRLGEGQALARDVRLERAAPLAVANSGEDAGPAAGRTWGYVSLGVGAAGLAASAVLGGLLLGKKGVIDDHCSDDGGPKRCDSAGYDAVGDAVTLSTAGTVTFAAGLAGVAAGAFLLVTSPRAPTKPVVGGGPGRGGLAFAYRF